MGNPAKSCLSIIACRSGPADKDEVVRHESGVSSDKHRWSFRRRSSRHRPLSNTVTSDPPSICSIQKESPEANRDVSNSPADPFILEKLPSPKEANENLQESLDMVDEKVVDVSLTTRDRVKPEFDVQESASAAVIQAAVRGYLVRKEILKHKSIVKLQAAVRGHLVRRQASGTLRCIRAVMKMQDLVRARLVHQSAEEITIQEKKCSGPKQRTVCSSTGKLLMNRFARQLLESAPRSKSIYIHSDPSKSESAWKWLELWMALSSSRGGQEEELSLKSTCKEESENMVPASHEVVAEVSFTEEVPIAAAKSSPVLQAQIEDTSIGNAGHFEFQTPPATVVEYVSQVKSIQEHHQPKNGDSDNATKGNLKLNLDEIVISSSEFQSSVVPFNKPEEAQDNFTEKTFESVETDKKFVVGTKKACNPAFAAAQAKFEELSSVGSLKSKNCNQDISVASRSEHLVFDSFTKNNTSAAEESVSQDPKMQTATSECGTEISISSTLDSPDRSEAEGGEIVLEIGSLERKSCDENGSSLKAFGGLSSDTKIQCQTEDPVLQSSNLQVLIEKPTNVVKTFNSVELEKKPSLEHVEERISCTTINVYQANVIDQGINRSTPDGSPRSHATALESHETPSSQTSVNKKVKVENSIHRRKEKSEVTVRKKSPSTLGAEHLPKETKSAKRRNSFGMVAISDHEHEARTSTSISIPNYMLATESARAKVASNSPKSSPDVHKDGHARKRHSLPAGSEKLGSPRMPCSSSQMQPNMKQNVAHSPHNSAERRWQR